MSKSGTWPGNVATESLSNMDSAGSCDSVISTNSAWSEDSMEYLSAEEKACLMFLEETIEALEVQEDSGLSNDEPDIWSKTEPQDQIRNVPTEMLKSGSLRIADSPPAGLTTQWETKHHTANQNSGYTILSSPADKTIGVSKLNGDPVLENVTNFGDASEKDLDIIPPPTDFRDEPELDLLPEAMTVVLPPADMTVEAMTVVPPPAAMTVEAMTVVPPPAAMTVEAMTVVPPPDTMTVVSPPDTRTVVSPPDTMTMLPPPDTMTVVPPPDTMTVVPPPDTMTVVPPPDTMTVVPPPDTMTVVPPPNTMTVVPPPDTMTVVPPPDTMTVVPPPSNVFTKQKQTVDVEQMRLRASVKKSGLDSSASEDSSSKASEVSSILPQMIPPSEPRSPPAVAPKPKKLPSNIILKSPKTSRPVPHGTGGTEHSVPSHSDQMLLNPQKVRMEALKKLGLLKDNKEESSRAVSPKLPLKSPAYKWSPASPSPPVSAAAPHIPPVKQSLTPVSSPQQAFVPQQSVLAAVVSPSASSASPPIEDADILPAPAAFSDGVGPSGDELPADTEAPFSTLPNTSPPKVISMKSATLERSGLGLSNQSLLEIAEDEQDLNHLRNIRPRPASLGTGKDFSHTKDEGLVASGTSESQKPQPSQAFHRRESSKLPRSQGISVVICPRAENEEDRRQALKKLGLLRD